MQTHQAPQILLRSKRTLDRLRRDFDNAREVYQDIPSSDLTKEDKEIIGLTVEQPLPSVAFFGGTNTGKTTVLNAVLGLNLLQTGSTPTTARILQLAWAKKEDTKIQLIKVNELGEEQIVEEERLVFDALDETEATIRRFIGREGVTEQELPDWVSHQVVLFWPFPALECGITMYDVPGFAKTEHDCVLETMKKFFKRVKPITVMTYSSLTDQEDTALAHLKTILEDSHSDWTSNVLFVKTHEDLSNFKEDVFKHRPYNRDQFEEKWKENGARLFETLLRMETLKHLGRDDHETCPHFAIVSAKDRLTALRKGYIGHRVKYEYDLMWQSFETKLYNHIYDRAQDALVRAGLKYANAARRLLNGLSMMSNGGVNNINSAEGNAKVLLDTVVERVGVSMRGALGTGETSAAKNSAKRNGRKYEVELKEAAKPVEGESRDAYIKRFSRALHRYIGLPTYIELDRIVAKAANEELVAIRTEASDSLNIFAIAAMQEFTDFAGEFKRDELPHTDVAPPAPSYWQMFKSVFVSENLNDLGDVMIKKYMNKHLDEKVVVSPMIDFVRNRVKGMLSAVTSGARSAREVENIFQKKRDTFRQTQRQLSQVVALALSMRSYKHADPILTDNTRTEGEAMWCGERVMLKILGAEGSQIGSMDGVIECKHLVGIRAICEMNDSLYAVYSCTETKPLSVYIKQISKEKKTIHAEIVLRMILCVGKGLKWLHKNNIIHRSLNAKNIQMSEDFDFTIEIPKTAINSVGAITVIEHHNTKTAPELLKKQGYKSSLDIFYFGVIIEEMAKLMGNSPTIQQSLLELATNCQNQHPADRPSAANIVSEVAEYRSRDDFKLYENKPWSSAVNELLTQQRNYVKGMKSMIEGVYEPLRRQSGEPKELLSNIEILYRYAKELSDALNKAMTYPRDHIDDQIAASFLSCAPYLIHYAEYSKNYYTAAVKSTQDPKYKNVINAFENSKEMYFNSFQDHMAHPAQMLMRYPMFLESILKSRHNQNIEHALGKIKSQVEKINAQLGEEKRAYPFIEIQLRLNGQVILQPGRVFLCQSEKSSEGLSCIVANDCAIILREANSVLKVVQSVNAKDLFLDQSGGTLIVGSKSSSERYNIKYSQEVHEALRTLA